MTNLSLNVAKSEVYTYIVNFLSEFRSCARAFGHLLVITIASTVGEVWILRRS